MKKLDMDKHRYGNGKIPSVQKYFRLAAETKFLPLKLLYKCLFSLQKKAKLIELSASTQIGGGLYLGHIMCITINPAAVIGSNVNIHKGVTIGQENRGARKGTPTIGDCVWIGVNATIVGNIRIGNDVLIAPNTYVNCDVPDHCVVFGNPCIIKPREGATQDYINRKAPIEESFAAT